MKRQTINVISSAQPWNLYSGPAPTGMTEAQDNEQYWMRDLATRIVDRFQRAGHIVRLAPLANHFQKNVDWCNANRADWIFSVHSNATAKVGDVPKGIGIYTNKAFTAQSTRELAAAFQNSMRHFPGGSYISTLTVAELSRTKDRCILGEFQFHDSPEMAGWIRDVNNRNAMADAFVAGFTSIYGSEDTVPLSVPSPTVLAAPAFPLPRINGRNAYFGPKSGPAHSVSGYFSYREELRRWQTQAATKNAYTGRPDGLYGPLTRNAALDIQRRNGVYADGLIGPVTWRLAWAGR